MVKALHRAGIEVILDVVYNHTTEGGADGPTMCFRGFANDTYYILDDNASSFADYSGCGNTLNANQSIVRRLILDSLHYWVTEMHVDGFRFDLASILSPRRAGPPDGLAAAALGHRVGSGARQRQVDCGSVGRRRPLPGRLASSATAGRNGTAGFATTSAAFVKGDSGTVHALAFRLTGSPDVFGHEEREAEQSINFVTCHDGFTLNDLVSYNTKHNEANGHDNLDGASDNLSWNCGVEGPSDDPAVERLRNRQVKNFLTLTMLAVGTPMLLMGDEVRRTQRGNNNAYCINDETTWFDWDLVVRHGDVHRFAKELIALRVSRNLPIERFGHDAAGDAAAPARHVARRQVERAGLGPRLAHAGGDHPPAWRPGPAPRHRQRLLGGARVRDPSARRCALGVAAHHRHVARFTGRRVRLGGRADGAGLDVCRAARSVVLLIATSHASGPSRSPCVGRRLTRSTGARARLKERP